MGIVLRDARRVRRPRTLAELREWLPGFAPPQSFRYLSDEEMDQLAIELDVVSSPSALGRKVSTSAPLTNWRSSGLERMREFEVVHAKIVGSSRGRRWGGTQLNRAITEGFLQSAEMMCDELRPAKDELSAWALGYGPELWVPPDARILHEVKNLVIWAQGRVTGGPSDLLQSAVNEFAAGDVFLVATAAARGLTVVTHEQSAPAARKRILIPDACAAASVSCVDPWTMLEDLNDRLSE